MSGMGWRRGVLIGVVALLAAGSVVALVGSGQDGGDDAGSPARAAEETTDVAPAGDTSAAMTAGGGGGTAGSGEVRTQGAPVAPVGAPAPAAVAQPDGVVPPAPDRVIRRAELSVEVRRNTFSQAFDDAARVASRYDGFVADSSSTSSDDRLSSGSLTIRVPSDRFDAARADLARLGKLERQQVSGEDVGDQLVDLGARIASLRAQEDALRTLMTRATTIGETLEVQNQLFGIRQQIEVLTAQQAQLQDSAQLATITVSLTEPGVAPAKPAEPSEGLAHSVERALDGAEAVVGGTIVVLGYAVPLAVLAALVWLGFRLSARRRVLSAS